MDISKNSPLLNNRNTLQNDLFHDAAMPIAVTDMDLRYLDVNKAFCNLLGYSMEELLTMSIEDVTHPDDITPSLNTKNNWIEGKSQIGNFEKRYITKNGEIIWARLNLSVFRDNEGNAVGCIGFLDDITSFKETEIQLKHIETLSRLKEIAAKIGSFSISFDPDDTFWSKEIFDIYEYDAPTPPTFDDVLALKKPKYRDQLLSAINTLLSNQTPFDLQVEITTYRNSEKWLHIHAEANTDSKNAKYEIIGTIQDITKQKREEQIRSSLSTRLLTTLETISDAFYLIDKDYKIIYVNKAVEELLNVKREEYIGENFWHSFPTAINTPLFKGFREAFRNNKPFQCEYYSEYIGDWIQLDAYPTVEGLAVYYRSISEQRKLLAKIQESETRLDFVTRATLDAAWDKDLIKNTIWWNNGLKNLFGYKTENNSDTQETDIDFWENNIHSNDLPKVKGIIENAINNKKEFWEAEYRFRREDGTFAHVQDNGFLIRNENDQVVRMVGGITDITEKQELREQLHQSQRLEAVGQLTGGIAHDFNNLLTVILGNIELLKIKMGQDSNLQNYASLISDASKKGAELTQRLLAFARKQSLKPENIDINQLLRDMKSLLNRTLGENIRIIISENENTWPVLIDANQMEAAMLNLCINARDAMPQGGELTISTEKIVITKHDDLANEISPGNYITVKVKDNGTGISNDCLPKVFEPFFTTKEVGKGSGLGLSTVFGFMKQSNGHTTIESSPGKGTCVSMYLPLGLQSEARIEEDNPQELLPGGSEKILLVEDDELVLSLAENLLDSFGYSVMSARDGEEAMYMMQKSPDLDLLFTDVIMPGKMDGISLADSASKLVPKLKILYTSGYTKNKSIEKALKRHHAQLLKKPYHPNQLAFKIREVLDN